MSRCFPYPPPGYYKIGATTREALIESIKLQKETVKPVKDKSERKKEKREKKERKEKKRDEKEKRKAEEKQAIQKNPNEFQLNTKEACFEKTESKIVTELRSEHLEKSDLTEEHGQPTTSQKPSYSSDSTQNSNKRKRDDISIPDGSSGLERTGKPIKIRLLKKQKPDSNHEVLCSTSGRSDTTCLTGADAKLNLGSSNRKGGVPVTSGRENTPLHGASSSQTRSTPSLERFATKSNDRQGLQFSSKQSAPSSSARLPFNLLKHDMPGFNSNKTEAPAPSRSNKSDVEVLPSARQQPVSGYVKPVLPLNQKGLSSLDINKAKSIAAGKRPICEITVPDNSFPMRSVKRKEDQISGITKNILPGSSAPTRVEGKKEDSLSMIPKNVGPDNIVSTRNEKKNDDLISEIPPKVSLSRHEKKLQKKFSKYQKVIGSWVPPVFEASQLPVDDEDWLSRRGPKVAKDNVETGRELAQSSLWQPCARFLVEADIYALPYTIPF